jgi:hypothetical protein
MVKYNIELLKNIIERDGCIINLEDYDHLNRDCDIIFICNCGNIFQKMFRYLYEEGGGFCKNCTKLNQREKMKITNLERYGVEHALQHNEFRGKMENTNFERYGVRHAIQNIEIKEKIKNTNIERYNFEYPLQNEKILEKLKTTNIERYGVDNPLKNKEILEKLKSTNIERYGVDNPLKNKEIRDKIKNTNIEKYGCENPFSNEEIKDKIKNTLIEKYGVEHPLQSEDCRTKLKNTCMDRYGYEYYMQNELCAEKVSKNAYNLKLYIFKCGNIVNVQGYEPFALEVLEKNGFTYTDLIINKRNVPEIWYINKKILHKYYCDIYIPKENLIIEIKSIWTYNKNILKNILKAKACKDKGYMFETWIFDKKGNLNVVYF